MRQFVTVLVAAGVFALAGLVQGQSLVLKDKTRLGPDKFAIEGGKIVKLVNIQGQTSKVVLSPSSIEKLEWPEAEQLTKGNALMAAGKTAEAAQEFKKGMETFEPLKDIEGNWYGELAFAYVDALSQGDSIADVVKAQPILKSLKLTDAQKLKLKIIQLNIDRQTGTNADTIVGQAQNILSETDDSAVGASLWGIIGDVYFKQKLWEKALLAYLRVPVFYGTQVQKVPEAEFNSAQCLAKMRRFEDAQSYYKRLIDTYPGSAIADRAQQATATINGLKNEDDVPPKAGDKKAADKKDAQPAKS